jgi:hypothetical protein
MREKYKVQNSTRTALTNDRGVTLTTHRYLVPRSRMSRSYTPLHPSAFVAYSGTALTISIYKIPVLSTGLYGSKNWAMKAKDRTRITASEMKFMGRTAKCT